MNPLTNLREAFLVFISLTFIALLNVGQLWEGHKISLEYVNMELISILELNEDQLEKINALNSAYDYELSKLSKDKSSQIEIGRKRDQLLLEKSEQIMKVLNEQQQEILYAYCTDLLSLNKVFE